MQLTDGALCRLGVESGKRTSDREDFAMGVKRRMVSDSGGKSSSSRRVCCILTLCLGDSAVSRYSQGDKSRVRGGSIKGIRIDL